ncbi:transcriptional regulator family: Fungal Specific TF [Penicillium hispanicum]|uniref:transcriptional regulator family: Fungal Specific TF n=1 Tax=Penicillium hispanicum TaxID=1080232 RepID=UPI002540A1AC|nr:transcriptional regulator family: Fungal Specific TF [Penicillium hispanicum]KAJ5569474.1 transcriptional regulator family: Fungal Specific TF [Penicillium hispanicum]
MQSSDGSRKRTSRACDSCYKRKTSRLSERISRIEQLLAENLMREPGSLPADLPFVEGSPSANASPTASSSSSTQPLIASSVGVHFAGRELGVISLLTGIPFLLPEGRDWIQARTGQTISRDKLSPSRTPWEKERAQSSKALLMSLQNPDIFELPDWRCTRLYFEAYKRSLVMRRIFPILDIELFEDTINAAYQQTQARFELGQASSRACIVAFLAFSSRLPPVKDQLKGTPFASVDHDALATKGEFMLAQVLQEPASLEGAQAVTMLTLYELSSGNMRATNYFGAITARLLFMLGGNLASSRTHLEAERAGKRQKLLRNLFWIGYTLDKDVCLRIGQPPTISDDNCDLTLPPGYLDRMGYDPEDEGEPWDQPVFPFDLRLSIIKSRAHTALYSMRARQKSDADLLKSIRELDDELEEWRLSIPPQWRPTMSFSTETSDPNISMYSVFLRLNYYLCMTLIHQASSRCKAWVEGSGMMDGVSSSLALSVEASRSTLCYLEAAEHVLVEGVFWSLVFYPISALLNIFCSILQNPLDPRSRDDLDRLRVAIHMMERIFSRQLPENEVVQIKLVADFVLELKHLAECAIDKAWREQSAGSLLSK